MSRCVALVRTDVSEELGVSVIRITRIAELVIRILVTLMMEALSSSVSSVLTRATRRNITEDAILHFTQLLLRSTLPYYSPPASSCMFCSVVNHSLHLPASPVMAVDVSVRLTHP
jgi:hypothetical protein